MMRIVVGVDPHGHCLAAIRLVGRLQFEGATAIAICSVEEPTSLGLAVPPDLGAAVSLDISRITEAAQKHALKVTNEAAEILGKYGIRTDAKMKFGGAADKLEEAAVEMGADLIAVGREDKGTLESLFFGSVSGSLAAHAKSSVLIGRGAVQPEGDLHVLFATDHSGYATRSLKKLVEFRPKGVSKVTIMSAYQVTINQNADMLGVPGVEPAIEESFRSQVEDRLKHAAEFVKPLGCEVDTYLVEADPDEGIAQAMKETGADIAALGAKGHSAIERFLLGSVAYHQVSHGTYPVIIIRH